MLNVVNSDEALQLITDNIPENVISESVSLEYALGRISSEDICSPEDLPAFARSTVDGYAIHSPDTFGCSESIPAMLIYDGEILMGEQPDTPLAPGHCMKIPTGGALPPGADAVSMIEYSDDPGDEFRYIYKPVSSLENVNNKGDDVQHDSVLVRKGELITSKNTAILAAVGISEVKVTKPVTVGIISTGDELVEYPVKPQGAQIRNINSVMLAGQVREMNAYATTYPIVEDELDVLREALTKAMSECDIVLISGGSSVGEKDNTFKILDELGQVHFHGISIKPGKPTLFATVGGKPVFGLPGHPQAAFFIFKLFVRPALYKMMGRNGKPETRLLTLRRTIPSNHGREEVVPVVITAQYADPLYSKSGMVSVLARADGYIRIPRDAEGLQKGADVEVLLL